MGSGGKRDKDNQYIDVWPINFPNPSERDAFDTTSLFMMQLACIVNMVAKWSKLMLRVCVCGEARQGSFSLSSNESHSDKLKNLLKLLRIKAKLFPVPGWSQVIESNQTDSNAYFQSINRMILDQSSGTAVTFIYLPIPPTSQNSSVEYLNMLDMITHNLPPSILVHGVNTVTSTTL